MPSQDNKDHVESPENQATPAPVASENPGEPAELTLQELEQRIAPLVVRKAGGTQMEY